LRFIRRHYFRRFLRPINRLKLTSDVLARTMAIGLGIGISATVGLQILAVSIAWLIARRIDRPFNIAIALLLTGVTNALTVPPLYSIYFVTGCAMTSCDLGAFQLRRVINLVADFEAWDLASSSWTWLAEPLFVTFVGSLPYTIAGAVAGWYFGRALGWRLHHRRARRVRHTSASPAPTGT
jgi:uncharacterized protein (DUF2062 family)